MQLNIHRSIWFVKLFLILAILLTQAACSNNGSTSEGRENNIGVDVSENEAASEGQGKPEETFPPTPNVNDSESESEGRGSVNESDSVTEKMTSEEKIEPEKSVDRSLFARRPTYEWRHTEGSGTSRQSISGRFLLLGPGEPNTHCYFKKWHRSELEPNFGGFPEGFALTGGYKSMETETQYVDDIHKIESPEPNVVYDNGSSEYVAIDETFTAVAFGESAIVEVGTHNIAFSEVLFHSCEMSSDTQAFAILSEDRITLALRLRPPNLSNGEATDIRCRYRFVNGAFRPFCPEDVSSSCHYRVLQSSRSFLFPNYRAEPKLLSGVEYRADIIDDRYTEIVSGESEVVYLSFDRRVVHNCHVEASSVISP